MNWCESISKAIEYIENNLTNDLSIETIFKGIDTSYYYETDEY